ncbi:MAG: zinc ribbon domain-containing protein [Lachnospiraceae bacterium]|nr:zinc ribbon domain-containing protein [Lachnospiraceae bacterium]
MMIICPVCGKETEGGYKFCMNCRSEIGADNASQAAQAAASQATETVQAAAATAATMAAPQIMAAPGAQTGAVPGASKATPPQNYETYEPYIKQGTIPDYSNYPNMYSAPDPNVVRVKQKKGPGGGRKFFAFFVCFFLFLSGLASLALYCVGKTLSAENIVNVVVDSTELTTIDVGKLTGNSGDEGKTISEFIMEQIPEDQKERFPGLTEDSINEILTDEDTKVLASEVLGDLTGYLTGEKEEFAIDPEKTVELLKEHSDKIETMIGQKLNAEDYASIKEEIGKFNTEEMAKLTGGEQKGVAEAMKAVRWGLSGVLLKALIGVSIFFILLVFLIFGRYVDSALIRLGLTAVFVGGAACGGVKIGELAIEKSLVSRIGVGLTELLDKAVFTHFEKTGMMVIFVGVGAMAVGILWKIILPKKNA